MPAETHSAFKEPADKRAMLWRYIDFSKYISLLDSGGLFFSRADRLSDSHEGALPYKQPSLTRNPKFDARISSSNKWDRQWTYVSCWHMKSHESVPMWERYTNTAEAIAIQTRYDLLHNALPERTYVGMVKYIDFESAKIPTNNKFFPYVHKRQEFVDEQEVRAVRWDAQYRDGRMIEIPNPEGGELVEVDLASLVEQIYVKPGAPKWFVEIVGSVTKAYGYTFNIVPSILGKEPKF